MQPDCYRQEKTQLVALNRPKTDTLEHLAHATQLIDQRTYARSVLQRNMHCLPVTVATRNDTKIVAIILPWNDIIVTSTILRWRLIK